MVGIAQVRPNPSGPRKRQLSIQHFHAGVVRSHHFGLKQDLLLPSDTAERPVRPHRRRNRFPVYRLKPAWQARHTDLAEAAGPGRNNSSAFRLPPDRVRSVPSLRSSPGGCRPLRFFVCSWSGVSFCSSTADSDSSSSGSLAFQSDSNNASCSFYSCSLFRVRCALSSSRSKLRNLSFLNSRAGVTRKDRQ
jgi:hypothetical protein